MSASIWSPSNPTIPATELVDNIAALRALSGVVGIYSNNGFVQTKGYYTPGDGGFGAYYIDTADTTSVDNGGTIIVADDGHRWKLLIDDSINIKQFGARGIGTDDTTFILNAINWAYNNQTDLYVPPGNYGVAGSITRVFTGIRNNQSWKWWGAGRYASRFTKLSGAGPTIIFNSSDTDTTVSHVQGLIQDIGFFGNAKNSHAIQLNGIGSLEFDRVLIDAHDTGVALNSCLLIKLNNCDITANNNGVVARRIGTNAYCNGVQVNGSHISYNSNLGADIGQGNGVWFDNQCTMEANGTAGNANTGAYLIRSTVDDEFGFAVAGIKNCLFESNLGTTIRSEGATELNFVVDGVSILNPEAGRAITVPGGRFFALKNSNCVGNSSTVTVASDRFIYENSACDVLTDTSLYPYYIDSRDGLRQLNYGRPGFAQLALTEITVPNNFTVDWVQQGTLITMRVPQATGTSANANQPKLTGLPAGVRPTSNRQFTESTINNGVEAAGLIIINPAGEIVLHNGYSTVFTAANAKGSGGWTHTYSIV